MDFFRKEARQNSTIALGLDIMLIRQTSHLSCNPIKRVGFFIRENLRDCIWYLRMIIRGHIIVPVPAVISTLNMFSQFSPARYPPYSTVSALYAASWPDQYTANEIIATYLRFIATRDECYGLNPYDRRFLDLLKRWRIYQFLTDLIFKSLHPTLYLAIHSGYFHHQVPCLSAVRYSVSTLVLGCNDCLYRISNREVPRAFEFLRFSAQDPPVDFLQLAERGKTILSKRLRGFFDSTIPYMKTSAYQEAQTNRFWSIASLKEYLSDTTYEALNEFHQNGFLTVFMHELNDWHHNGVLPPFATSYFDWLINTLSYLNSQGIPYVLKIHPCIVNYPESYLSSIQALFGLARQLGGTLRVTTCLTTPQLITAGMKLGVTVRGTVALELAYLKTPFLCAGRPPFASLFPLRTESDADNYYQRLLQYHKEPNVTDEEATLAAYYVARQETYSKKPDVLLDEPAINLLRLSDDQAYLTARSWI